MKKALALLLLFAPVLPGCKALFGGGSSSSSASLAECEAMWRIRSRAGHSIHVPMEPPLTFNDFELTAEGQWVTGDVSPCGLELAERLTDLCDLCNADQGACEGRIIKLFEMAPAACAVCGDGQCFESEDSDSCPQDCRENCGDGYCSDGETPLGCPVDCGTGCGDGLCNAPEDQLTCPVDCSFTQGDGFCGPGEDANNSPIDCGRQTCGDAFCQSYETALRCPEDCCLPRGCEVGAQACGSSGDIVECVAASDEDCREWVEVDNCEYGCIPSADGPRCRTCTDIAEGFFGNVAYACDAATFDNVCTGGGAQQCVPVPGFNACGHIVITPCTCVDGYCVDNCTPTGCNGRYQACDAEGDITRCRTVAAAGCEYPEAYYDCPANSDCTEFDNNSASCCPADACVTDGIDRCIDGQNVERCVVEEGRYCGTWQPVETCSEGSGCDIGGAVGDFGCMGCCVPGETACFTREGYDTIGRCDANADTPGCGRWADLGVCEGIMRCDDSGPTATCVPR